MTISQWTRLLVEDNLTMYTLPDHTMEFIPCKAELASPTTDRDTTWQLVRLQGLGPEHTSFLWKLVHLLLPIKERIHRLSPTTSPLCTMCNDNMIESLHQTFNSYSHNNGAGPALVAVLRNYMPTINMEKIMRLEFNDLEEDMEFPTVWFTAAFLLAIWEHRQSGTRIRCYEIRAEIEGKISLLRETRFPDHVKKLKLLRRNIE